MQEIELKFLEVNQEEIIAKLLGFGATKVFDDNIVGATLFDFPDGRLDAKESFIRLRRKGATVELAYKERMGSQEVKEFKELEVTVSDENIMREILDLLGFVVTRVNPTKSRKSYAIEDVHFEFDTFEGIPTYLEIETQNEELLFQWVEKLGLKKEDAKPWSNRDILRHYKLSA